MPRCSSCLPFPCTSKGTVDWTDKRWLIWVLYVFMSMHFQKCLKSMWESILAVVHRATLDIKGLVSIRSTSTSDAPRSSRNRSRGAELLSSATAAQRGGWKVHNTLVMVLSKVMSKEVVGRPHQSHQYVHVFNMLNLQTAILFMWCPYTTKRYKNMLTHDKSCTLWCCVLQHADPHIL